MAGTSRPPRSAVKHSVAAEASAGPAHRSCAIVGSRNPHSAPPAPSDTTSSAPARTPGTSGPRVSAPPSVLSVRLEPPYVAEFHETGLAATPRHAARGFPDGFGGVGLPHQGPVLPGRGPGEGPRRGGASDGATGARSTSGRASSAVRESLCLTRFGDLYRPGVSAAPGAAARRQPPRWPSPPCGAPPATPVRRAAHPPSHRGLPPLGGRPTRSGRPGPRPHRRGGAPPCSPPCRVPTRFVLKYGSGFPTPPAWIAEWLAAAVARLHWTLARPGVP